MYIPFQTLAQELARNVRLQQYSFGPQQIIMGIDLLPIPCDPATAALNERVAYLCEYWQIEQIDPDLPLPPIICVVGGESDVLPGFFRRRNAIVVYGCTFLRLMVLLMHSAYDLGSKSLLATEVSRSLLKCTSVQELMEEGYRAMKNPLILTDGSQRIISHTDPDLVTSPLFRAFLADGILPLAQLSVHVSEQAQGNKDVPFFTRWGYEDSQVVPVACKMLYVGNSSVGFLYMLQLEREADEADSLDFNFFSLLGDLLAVHLAQRTMERAQQPGYGLEKLMKEVLDNTAGDQEKILAQQQELGISFKSTLYALIFHRLSDASPLSFSLLAEQISGSLPGCHAIFYKNGIFALLESDDAIRDFNTFLQPLTPLLRKYDLILGVSNPFPSLLSLRVGGFQAERAILLGQKLHPGEQVCLYDDYAMYHMAEVCLQQGDLYALCHPGLLRLIDYCKKHDSPFLHTLQTYLACNENKSATADRLHLHLSTIKYHIAQIQSIAGVNLNDGETVLRLNFSFKLLELNQTNQEQLSASQPPV